MEPILHGLILAFGLILPLGVQNVFVFSQGATQLRLAQALPATITAAISDTLLILLSVFGLSMIVLQFEWLRVILMITGILFLLYMGSVIWKSETTKKTNKALPIRQQIIFALSVSFLNPHAILDIVGVIGVSAIKYAGKEQFLFTITCITVSWIWFFGLMIAGAFVKKLDGKRNVLQLFNKFSAIFIWGTAIYIFLDLM
ncbi:LysE family transporter [Cytobacillus sp. FSL W7-1323]|uniref:Lysine transporter LysE n=1 Tax=Cytobacillus kochii TaxID=859143 RepID=A0A248TGZ4_9BACI|nr:MULTISPECIES: LysE family transporter [Cytobacillus]ASV67484.1 lysine transporter LysE [Cytobacillus kochii]MDM5205652.1 LysE family transporter [Cytobacillus kochii]MDQ0185688.1 L-lysine exporter family protein LysE/ArgO [Cytobacillus kochii]MEA1854776.1 LysE family transporter [Cytobacillus sp. OWB-43]